MKKITKKIPLQNVLPGTPSLKKEQYHKMQLKKWKQNGCPVPPPHVVKQKTIKQYQRRYEYDILVETGTFLGDMVEAQMNTFKKIYSIELGADLYLNAKRKFRGADHIEIIYGDSTSILPILLERINEPSIFWLDGHYSGGITAKGDKECPIMEELDAILADKKRLNHIILIDDARCFTGKGDFPAINELTEYIRSKNQKYTIDIKDDIIRCTI